MLLNVFTLTIINLSPEIHDSILFYCIHFFNVYLQRTR